MIVLVGEWVPANLLFGAAFLVAVGGVIALGWYVMRGDRLNRVHLPAAGAEEGTEVATGTRGHVEEARAENPDRAH